jgi:hypothetical protein
MIAIEAAAYRATPPATSGADPPVAAPRFKQIHHRSVLHAADNWGGLINVNDGDKPDALDHFANRCGLMRRLANPTKVAHTSPHPRKVRRTANSKMDSIVHLGIPVSGIFRPNLNMAF